MRDCANGELFRTRESFDGETLRRASASERMQEELVAAFDHGGDAMKAACKDAVIAEFGEDAGFTQRLTALLDSVVVQSKEDGATHG